VLQEPNFTGMHTLYHISVQEH